MKAALRVLTALTGHEQPDPDDVSELRRLLPLRKRCDSAAAREVRLKGISPHSPKPSAIQPADRCEAIRHGILPIAPMGYAKNGAKESGFMRR